MFCLRMLVACVIASLFTCCSAEKNKNNDAAVFSYNEMNGVTSLDPAAASNFENISQVNQLFEGLLQMDDSLNVIPAIARSYTINADASIYTFFLRTDVSFHDDPCFENGIGRKVNARDFVYSFNRLFDSKVSSALSLLDNIDRTVSSATNGFEARNDSTFVIYLKKPFSAFPSILSMKYFSVVPREAIDLYGMNFRSHPVGTGPFRFHSWHEGNKLVLHRNPNYHEEDENGNHLPYLEAMTVSFIRDRESAFMELLNGKFDMLSGADAFNTNEVLDKSGELRDFYRTKFYLQKGTFLKTDYIGILVDADNPQVRSSPLRLKAVRQAINYAFDRRKMIRYLRNNLGLPAHAGFISPGLKSFDTNAVKGYRYDPAKTAALLAEAGYPGGKGLPELTLHVTEQFREQTEFIQSQLAQNNIKVQISVEKPSVLRQSVNAGEFLLFKKSWVADYPDEENYMSLFYSKNFCPKGVNFFHYSNPRFDSLFEAALKENDQSRKVKLYQQMDQLISEDAPVITLFYDQVIRLVSHNVSGLTSNPMNLLNLKRVKKHAEAQRQI